MQRDRQHFSANQATGYNLVSQDFILCKDKIASYPCILEVFLVFIGGIQ